MNEFEENDLDRKLTQALRRVDASLGFADRVMRRVEAPAPKRWSLQRWRPWQSAWAGSALAAMLVLGVFAGEQLHQRHERALATQQFETATRITDATLAHTREQLAKAGVPLD